MSELPISHLIDPNERLIDRDLSWLQFNERVLQEAQDEKTPLVEKLKFLGITASNLDEFFMIRYATLERELASLRRHPDKHEEKLKRLLAVRTRLHESVKDFGSRQARALQAIAEELSSQGVQIIQNVAPDSKEWGVADEIFTSQILPNLLGPEPLNKITLQTLDNLEIALIYDDAVIIRVSRLVPPVFSARLSAKQLVIFFLDDLLKQFGKEILGTGDDILQLRVTRDADVTFPLEYHDPAFIAQIVRRRIITRQQRNPLRLQYRASEKKNMDLYSDIFKLPMEQMYPTPSSLLLHGLVGLVSTLTDDTNVPRKLFYPTFKARIPEPLERKSDIFAKIKERDYLLHHPYDSFDSYVNLIAKAVEDPSVTSIEQTVYRSDAASEVLEMLSRAAETKRVRVLIEPRARFDEINNVELAETLRRAGVDAVFTTGTLKMHAKIALITRKENGETTLYTHLSTGNYNAKTSRTYTDMAIVTSHSGIGADAVKFFNAASLGKVPEGLKHLVLAPTGLHRRVVSLIRSEKAAAQIGVNARIFAKVNALVDPRVIEALYEASQAGVKIDLLVRGACALRPGVKGMSENIRVISIVDRFLEHSRMYHFASSGRTYLSSADWMPRNFHSRLEIAFPILDGRIQHYLTEVVIPTYLNDRVKARVLTAQGYWRSRKQSEDNIRSQFYFLELAAKNYKGTPLE